MTNKKDLGIEDLEKVSGGLGVYITAPEEKGYWYWITYTKVYRGQEKKGGFLTAELRDIAMNAAIASIEAKGGKEIKYSIGYNEN